jgi:hypothetical protein
VKGVKVESNWALATRLWRAARSVESLGTTHVRARKIL